MSEAIVFVALADPEQKPRFYACQKCGQLYSPSIYLAREEVQRKTAREAAENCYNCREHNVCSDCGVECSKHSTKCDACRKRSAFAKAKIVAESEIEQCFGYDGTFYHEVEEAREAGEEWVFDASFRPFRIDPDSVLENTVDDHHEDASVDDLDGVGPLVEAIKAFNLAQTSGTYDEDRSRIAVLKQDEPLP